MAYINVAEWTPDQVTDWLKGLDNSMYHYIHSFTNNEVRGQQLLQIRPYELEQLGMYSIGHQEIVLEAVEHLRNFHHHLDKENLQFLALHIATASQCLHNQLARCVDRSKIETQCLSDVTRTIATIKPLIGWLDRAPFHRINRFVELRNKMLRFAFEMATMAQRDRFVENPVDQIKQTALRVAKLANYIIQDVSDVMILQPATLNLVTLKKKESELGFNIVPSASGIHVITDIKYNSPAHTSGKIEDGDEIVQINYQTVVGWHYKKVIQQLHESPPDILLTLKKRPKHSKIYGQIYMKPYRLPSKKKAPPYRWGGDGLPSPRVADLLQLPPALKRDMLLGGAGAASSAAKTGSSSQPVAAFPMPPVGQQVVVMSGSGAIAGTAALNRSAGRAPLEFAEKQGRSSSVGGAANISKTSNTSTTGAASDSDDCSDIMTPTNHKASDKDLRLYLPKTRAVLQRRNTICGDHVTGFKSNVMFWHDYKDGEADSPSLRDKSVSFGFGLEIAARPTTYLGIGPMAAARFGGGLPVLKGSLPDIVDNSGCASTATGNRDEEAGASSSAKPQGISKLVRFDSSKKCNEYKDNRYACNVENTILEVFEPIPYVDEEDEASGSQAAEAKAVVVQQPETEAGITQAVNEVLVRREIEKWEQKTGGNGNAKLASPEPIDTPPAIEPRSDFLHKTPPAPPPRPRKLSTIPSSASFHGKPQYGGSNLLASPPGNNPQPSTLPKPSPRHHLHISEPIREPLKVPAVAQPIPPQPIYNSQQQLQLSESFLQPDPNNDLVEYNNTRSFRTDDHQLLDASTKSANEAPTEILELVTPNKTKNLTLKKKNSIMAKRRNITLKTLEVSDIQGHLYRRTKDKHGVTYWAKLYMVLADTSLYGFRAKDSDKADCLIFLNGFTVSLANEVHSKPFAFKVYHPSKTFYFAAESQMALAQWIEYIRKATLKGASAALDKSHIEQAVNLRELFSETESSDGEMDFGQVHKILGTPSPLGSRFAHKKSFCGSNASNLNAADDGGTAAPAPKSEKYHLGFGSLKKFSWSSSASKAAKAEKKLAASSSDVPVPTAQFRSYRKVPGNAGLQLGTNSMISSPGSSSLQAAVNLDFSLSPPGSVPPAAGSSTSHDFHTPPTRSSELSSSRSMTQAATTPTPPAPSAAAQLPHQSTPLHPQPPRPRLHQRQHSFSPDPINLMSESFQAARDLHFDPKKLRKNAPYHYIHASNPNLVEFDFSTAKTLDWTLPKMQLQMSSNAWETSSHHHHHHHNHHHHHHIQHHHSNSLQGFVTLKDLMLQKQEDDAKEMYNNRVTLGVEKKLDPAKAAAAAKQALRDQQLQQLQLQQPQQSAQQQQQQQQSQSSRRSQISIASTTQTETGDNCSQYGGSTTSKIQSRSLPKTPDYAQSFKPDDSDIIMTRSREGQKLRDFGYEFISGDDAPGAVLRPRGHAAGATAASSTVHQLAAASGLLPTASMPAKKKGVGLNWIGGSGGGHGEDKSSAVGAAFGSASRSGSVKKTKSDKLFQFKHSSGPQTPPDKPLKPSFLPLTLPGSKLSSASASASAAAYKQPATHVYNMHGHARLISPSTSIDESGVSGAGTYRSTVKKDMTSPTPSAASSAGGGGTSMFNKLTFGAGGGSSSERKTAKEKKLLGSPRLHRALFGGGGSGRRESDVSHDHEPCMPMEPKPLARAIVHEHDIADIAPTQLPPPTPHRVPNLMAGFSAPEYPNLEYPPVFEPETYSLNDPNASLTLLRRRNQPNNRSK